MPEREKGSPSETGGMKMPDSERLPLPGVKVLKLVLINLFDIIRGKSTHGGKISKLQGDGIPHMVGAFAVGEVKHQVV